VGDAAEKVRRAMLLCETACGSCWRCQGEAALALLVLQRQQTERLEAEVRRLRAVHLENTERHVSISHWYWRAKWWRRSWARRARKAEAALSRCEQDKQQLREALDGLHESLFIGSERGLTKHTLREMARYAKAALSAASPGAEQEGGEG
jgi:hypothetical protein